MMKDASEGVKSKLILVISLVSFFICLEALGAYISNSIAIFTDVLHLFSDLLGFVLSLLSVYYAAKKASKE
jgi:Co/Zn/Cd efflux system component